MQQRIKIVPRTGISAVGGGFQSVSRDGRMPPAAPALPRPMASTTAKSTTAALILTALLAGCAAPRSAAPPAVTLPAEHVVYRCASGRMLDAAFSQDTAIVRYAGQTHRMRVAISASGARYVGDNLVWWTKGSGPGSEGTLYREEPGNTSGAVLEACTWEGRS